MVFVGKKMKFTLQQVIAIKSLCAHLNGDISLCQLRDIIVALFRCNLCSWQMPMCYSIEGIWI
jgi:hypothetical protein